MITINAAHPLGPVNRLVFGDNIEAGDSRHVYADVTYLSPIQTGNGFWDDGTRRPDPYVVERMKEVGLSTLRYPGGSLANLYDWHKAVGPLATRGDWHFGIDEYIATCRAIGAEPQFIVADYVGTPKDAAGLVEYLNGRVSPGRAERRFCRRSQLCGRTGYNISRRPGHARLYGVRRPVPGRLSGLPPGDPKRGRA